MLRKRVGVIVGIVFSGLRVFVRVCVLYYTPSVCVWLCACVCVCLYVYGHVCIIFMCVCPGAVSCTRSIWSLRPSGALRGAGTRTWRRPWRSPNARAPYTNSPSHTHTRTRTCLVPACAVLSRCSPAVCVCVRVYVCVVFVLYHCLYCIICACVRVCV